MGNCTALDFLLANCGSVCTIANTSVYFWVKEISKVEQPILAYGICSFALVWQGSNFCFFRLDPCLLSILNIAVGTCQSQTLSLPLLPTISPGNHKFIL